MDLPADHQPGLLLLTHFKPQAPALESMVYRLHEAQVRITSAE
jgi:hypothetical protein